LTSRALPPLLLPPPVLLLLLLLLMLLMMVSVMRGENAGIRYMANFT